MPSGKARYTGWKPELRDVPPGLKQKLIALCPDPDPDRADEFAECIIAHARRALSTVADHGLDLSQPDLRAERESLLRVLEMAIPKLRNMSRDLDRILNSEADPLGCADTIDKLIEHLKAAAPESIDRKPRLDEVQRDAAVEMAIGILRVAKEYDIAPAATASADFDTSSPAVSLLKVVGEIGRAHV